METDDTHEGESYGLGISMAHESETNPIKEENQDFCYSNAEAGTALVLDGLGKYDGSKQASHEAGVFLQKKIDSIPVNSDPYHAADELAQYIQEASEVVNTLNDNNDESGFGLTTALAMKIVSHQGKRYAIIANVGDSIACLYETEEEKLHTLTLDRSPSTEVEMKNEFEQQVGIDNIQTEEDLADLDDETRARLEKGKNKTSKWLGRSREGMHRDTPDIYIIPLKGGIRIMLASDGPRKNIPQQEIAQILFNNEYESDQTVARKMTQRAIESFRNSTRNADDDATVVIVSVNGIRDSEELVSEENLLPWKTRVSPPVKHR